MVLEFLKILAILVLVSYKPVSLKNVYQASIFLVLQRGTLVSGVQLCLIFRLGTGIKSSNIQIPKNAQPRYEALWPNG